MKSRPAAEPQVLTDRDREILRSVVESYVLSGEPVSSRRVSKSAALDLSSASIRNTMADLEEMGLLRQPHASAGRVPTRRGYHLFIDSLMQTEEPSVDAQRLIDGELEAAADDPEELSSLASQLLSHLSSQVGLVVTPELGATAIRRIEFVPLTENKVLCVLVSTHGFVDNKVLRLDAPIERTRLTQLSNYISDNYAGRTLRQIRTHLLDLLSDERARVDAWLRQTIEVAQLGLEIDGEPGLSVQGTEALIGLPELTSVDRVRTLFETFSDRARVVALLGQCLQGDGVRVFIGEESDLTSDLDFSLIAKGFRVDGAATGGLAVFGPSRMEYARLIPLVQYLGDRLGNALEKTL